MFLMSSSMEKDDVLIKKEKKRMINTHFSLIPMHGLLKSVHT